jgi:hypothetical protein
VVGKVEFLTIASDQLGIVEATNGISLPVAAPTGYVPTDVDLEET